MLKIVGVYDIIIEHISNVDRKEVITFKSKDKLYVRNLYYTKNNNCYYFNWKKQKVFIMDL